MAASSLSILTIAILLAIFPFNSGRQLLQFPLFGGNTPAAGSFPPSTPSETAPSVGATPTNKFGFTSQTKGPAYGQVVTANGKPESEVAVVGGQNGEPPKVETVSHEGSQTANVNGAVTTNYTNGNAHATLSNGNGQPVVEAGESSNGDVNVTIYGSNGQPLFHFETPPKGA